MSNDPQPTRCDVSSAPKTPPPLPLPGRTPPFAPARVPQLVSHQDRGIIETIRRFIPVANYRAQVTVNNSHQVTAGTAFKAIVRKLPNSEASIEGDELIVTKLDHSLKLSFLDIRIGLLQWLDFDRRSWDITARFSAKKNGDGLTITADIHQGWTRFITLWLVGVPFIGQALFINIFVRTYLFGNPRIRFAVQRILDDVAKELRQNALNEKLNASIERLS